MGDRRPGGGGGGRKVLLPPINFIFKLLQQHNTVQIWLYEQLGIRIEGKIRGFDEFMNLVIDDAVEVKQPGKGQTEEDVKDQRRDLGMQCTLVSQGGCRLTTVCCRSDIAQRRQCLSHPEFDLKLTWRD